MPDATRPSSSACDSSTCAAWRVEKPATMRMRASSRRRSGTVSSIAMPVRSRPTIAAMAANSVVDWSFGAVATASARSSLSTVLVCSPASRAICSSDRRARSSSPGLATTRIRVARPGRPLSRCARSSEVEDMSVPASAPISLWPSTPTTGVCRARPRTAIVTGREGASPTRIPSASPVLADREMPGRLKRPNIAGREVTPPSLVYVSSTPTSSTPTCRPPYRTDACVWRTAAAACTPGAARALLRMRASKPSAPMLLSWSCARPAMPFATARAEVLMLVFAASTPNTSITPVAMPAPASSSCSH